VISGSSRLTRPAHADGHEAASGSARGVPDNQQERERDCGRAHRQADHSVRPAGKHEQEHAGEGAVAPIHPEEIEWMSELPMKNTSVNDRNSTPTSTAILL
jgi:hypothetical protein